MLTTDFTVVIEAQARQAPQFERIGRIIGPQRLSQEWPRVAMLRTLVSDRPLQRLVNGQLS